MPARNTIFLSLALGWAEVLGAARHRHRRQRARLLRLSRLPARVHRARSSGSPTLATRAGVEGARFRVHTPLIALTKAEIIRRGARAGPRLRPDAQLLRPGARRAAVRPLRQLRAARQRVSRGRRRRPAAPGLRIAANSVRISQRPAASAPGRRRHLRAAACRSSIAAVWSANRTRLERADGAARAGGARSPPTAPPTSTSISTGLDSMASALARHPGRDRARSRGSAIGCSPTCSRDQPLLLNIVLTDTRRHASRAAALPATAASHGRTHRLRRGRSSRPASRSSASC